MPKMDPGNGSEYPPGDEVVSIVVAGTESSMEVEASERAYRIRWSFNDVFRLNLLRGAGLNFVESVEAETSVRTPNLKSPRPLATVVSELGAGGMPLYLCSTDRSFGVAACFRAGTGIFSSAGFTLCLENIDTCVGILEAVATEGMREVLFALLVDFATDSSSLSFCLLGLEPWNKRDAIFGPRLANLYDIAWGSVYSGRKPDNAEASVSVSNTPLAYDQPRELCETVSETLGLTRDVSIYVLDTPVCS